MHRFTGVFYNIQKQKGKTMTEVQTTETQNSNPYSAFIPEIWSQKLNTMLEKIAL